MQQNDKPTGRPVSNDSELQANLPEPSEAPTEQPSYQKLPVGKKRDADIAKQREAAVMCPRCATQVMPADLLAHVDQRCPRELPDPHPASRWVKREVALRSAPSSVLSRWMELELLRTRGDGFVLERDLAVLVAWSAALGVL